MAGYLVVFIGGGLGAALRHGVNRAAFTYLGFDVPYGTLIVNVLGSLFLGMLVQLFALRTDVNEEMKLLLTTGLLGGFTTFSAFSLEGALMWQRGAYAAVAAYGIASVSLSIAALLFGMWVVRAIT